MNTCCNRREVVRTRREFLSKSALGFGALALVFLLNQDSAFSAEFTAPNPLAPKKPDFAVKARSVVYIFLQGGPSHVDTFDPKPLLNKLDGQLVPSSFNLDGITLSNIKAAESKLMGTRMAFSKYGKSGLEIGELFQNIAHHADDLAIIRSCYHDTFIHDPAINLMFTGNIFQGHPSIGAWVLYGLGSETQELPAFISIGGPNKRSIGSGYLPAAYQGTLINTEGTPIADLTPPSEIDSIDEKMFLAQLKKWNARFVESRDDDTRLAARINDYELAFRMQMAAPDLVDLSEEPNSIKTMYGMDKKPTEKFGHSCLLARRMVERGVRFIQLNSGGWDGHSECEKSHREVAGQIDLPISGLLADLKQRGLLETTLVVIIGEFGRTPVMQAKQGRDHHPYGFSICMAGGGIQGGKVIGATDELGFRATQDRVHVNDVHATILALLGLDHKKLTFRIQGRDRRLTDVGGDNELSARLTKA